MGFSVTSKMLTIWKLLWMVIASPWFLKCFMISFRFLSAWGPEVRLKRANPSSRYRSLSLDLDLSRSVMSRNRPTSSHISATSNVLLLSFTQAVALSNRRDFRQCMMILASWSVIVACVLA